MKAGHAVLESRDPVMLLLRVQKITVGRVSARRVQAECL